MRLFVAIDMPDPVKNMIEGLSDELAGLGARPVSRENMHITLLFIGEIPESKFPSISPAIDSVRTSRFSCELRGVGTLPAEKPRVVYAKITDGAAGMAKINSELRWRMNTLGIPTEIREFTPHLTIARMAEDADIEGIKSRILSAIPTIRFECSEIRLKKSVLSSKGAVHTDILVKRLAD